MNPAQLYETTIHNRDSGHAVRLVTVPTRSLETRETPGVGQLAEELGLQLRPGEEGRRAVRVEPVEAWSLPFLIDATLGRYPMFPRDFGFYFDPLEPELPKRGPTQFAQYLAYAPVVPFEASPLQAKSLAEVATATGSVGATVGYFATGDVILLVAVPAGVIIMGAAHGIGDALRIGLRARLLALMGVRPPPESPDSEQGS